MSARYFALLTNAGVAKIANAAALGVKLNITEMAVGDANGILPTPTPDQTKLVNERRRAPINTLSIDPQNSAQIIVEQVIPENVGGWWIKEVGLFDEDGDLIAVSNCPETYKPKLQEGSGRTQVVRVIIIVSSSETINIKIDPAVILATREYVGNQATQINNTIATLPLFNGVYDVFIIYGQSNAVGFARYDTGFNSSSLVALNKKAFFWNGTDLVSIIHEMNHSSGEISSGSAWSQFANTYIEKTGRGVIFIPCAKGATTIAELSKGGEWYRKMQESITAFDKENKPKYITIGTRDILFHQGETDQLNNTKWEIYQNALLTLCDNMRSDFKARNMYLFRVGNPQNRLEVSWQTIQFAQENLCNNHEYMKMAYDGCSGFLKQNKLLGSDGVHYSIKGYNLMGAMGANFVVDDIKNITSISQRDNQTFGNERMPGNAQWRRVSGIVSYDEKNGYQLRTVNFPEGGGGRGRSSNIKSIEVTSNAIRLNLSCSARLLLDYSLAVDGVTKSYDISLSASFIDDNTVDIAIYSNISFLVDISTGALKAFIGGPASDFVLKSVRAAVSGDVVTITHPSSQSAPIVQSYSDLDVQSAGLIGIRVLSDTEMKIKLSGAANYRYALVTLPNCKLNPNEHKVDGLQIIFGATVAGTAS